MATATLCGVTYPLEYTIGAVKKIVARFGNVQETFDEMAKAFEASRKPDTNGGIQIDWVSYDRYLDIAIFIVAVLADQGAARHNLMNPNDPPLPRVTEELVSLCSNAEVAEFAAAIADAVQQGSRKQLRDTKQHPMKAAAKTGAKS